MRKYITTFALCATFVLGNSFKPAENTENTDLWKGLAPNTFLARIDGYRFEAGVANYVVAATEQKTSITLLGNQIKESNGRIYKQFITVEYSDVQSINQPKITFEFKGKKYNQIPGTLQMSVAKLAWSTDKLSYELTADFECKVQGKNPLDNTDVIMTIKGKMQDLQVEMPVVQSNAVASAK